MAKGFQSRDLFILAWVLPIAAVIGAFIGFIRSDDGELAISMASGVMTGLIIAFFGTVSEALVFSNPRLRFVLRLPPIAALLLRALLMSLFIVGGLLIPEAVLGSGLVLSDPDFAGVFVVSALISLAFSIGIEVTRLLGAEATVSLFTGRYSRPRLEHRVILFADLVGSTSLAERIGELQFYRFLQEVALDLAEPIERWGGRVHRYVGDAVIVTWPLETGTQNASCLNCALDMHAVLAERAGAYKRAFDAAPVLRIAVHSGRVAAGEIGDWKKEISFLGDAMNTAARIETAARDLGANIVLSDAVVRQFPEEAQARLIELPPYQAHGKHTPLTLWGT